MAVSKIILGLKEAVRHARCDHAYTRWARTPEWRQTGAWVRHCDKCEVTEYKFSETEPAN